MGKRCTPVLTSRVDELIIIVGMTSIGLCTASLRPMIASDTWQTTFLVDFNVNY
jgi:hypothetical protein